MIHVCLDCHRLVLSVQIAKLAPDAVIHGREDLSPTASQRLSLRKPLTKKQPQQRDTLGRGDVPTGATENLDFSSSAQKQEFIAIRIRRQIIFALDGWKTYFRQPILLSSLTFVLLFFNVALSPGGLITAFLTAKGMDGTSMALFRGGCASTLSLMLCFIDMFFVEPFPIEEPTKVLFRVL